MGLTGMLLILLTGPSSAAAPIGSAFTYQGQLKDGGAPATGGTSVGSGSRLTGGPITGSGTISVAPLGITSAMIANGAVGSAQINQDEVQARVTTMCPAGHFLRGLNADGTALAIGAEGFPVISYQDVTAGDLKVAKCVNAACTGTSVITTVDDGLSSASLGTAIAMDFAGLPVIAYQDFDLSAVKVAKCVNPACSGASAITYLAVHPGGVSEHISIANGFDGFPIVSYWSGDGFLWTAKCNKSSCAR